MTTILFDATKPVKSTRRNFALGLTRTTARREKFEPSAIDLHEAAVILNANTTQYEVVGISDEGLARLAAENAHFD